MKQNYTFKRMLSAVLLLLASTFTWAYDFSAQNADGVTIYYNLINDGTEAEVTHNDYNRYYKGYVTIPSTIAYDGNILSVTSIGDGAFFDCSSLTSINIPNSVTSIGNQAFIYCSNLTSVNIPESVTNIGYEAFWQCNSLVSVNIPKSVTSIGGDAFWGCYNLTSVNISEGVTSIGAGAFSSCYGLTSIIIPNSVTSIGYFAFGGCSNLTSISIDESNPIYDSRDNCNAIIETASNTLVAGCQNTIIPESVTSIGGGAFYECSSLTSVTIPEGVTSIGYKAFAYCSSLTSVNIPEGVTSIGSEAFYNCSSLTSVNIPEGVTRIDQATFSGCTSLASVNISKCMTYIGYEAFAKCNSLVSVNIPESVTSIDAAAFRDCSSLTSINIPENVTGIGSHVFEGCSNLTSVISSIKKPYIIWDNLFDNSTIHFGILYCPDPEAYKATDGWNSFADIRPLEGEEEVTLAIGDAHYATFIAPFEVTIPTNVEAYTVSGIKEDGATLQMNRLMTETIPANTPVVLYSNDIVEESIIGWRSTQGVNYTEGLLTGVYKQRQALVDSYVLQNQNDKVAFYHVEAGAQPMVAANRAYLTVPEGANGVKALRFSKDDDETTGIQATMSDQESKAVIYDMTGRRVEKAVKGMYIIDGKKVMVK